MLVPIALLNRTYLQRPSALVITLAPDMGISRLIESLYSTRYTEGGFEMSDQAYVPPKVWVWESQDGGRFTNINRPIAGPTHDHELPLANTPYSSTRSPPQWCQGNGDARGAA